MPISRLPISCFRVANRRTWLFASVLLLCPALAHAASTVLHYYPSGSIYTYRWALLQLALDHVEKRDHQHYQLQPLNDNVTQWRAESMLENGELDIVAFGSTPQREQKLLPVRMDILKGILGYRVFFVRKQDVPRIKAMTAQQFRQQLRVGLNSQWADYPIMKNNGYQLVASVNYDSLFDMLAAGRFDVFPRGLNEVGSEMQEQLPRHPELTLEGSKAVYFPFPIYFWVNKKQEALAHRIQQGLKLAEQDGSFKALFLRSHADAIRLLNESNWKTTLINNTELPPGNAKPDTSWWWKRR